MLKFATADNGSLLGDLCSKGWKTQPKVWNEEDEVHDAWLGRTDCRGSRELCRRRIGDSLTQKSKLHVQNRFSQFDIDIAKFLDF